MGGGGWHEYCTVQKRIGEDWRGLERIGEDWRGEESRYVWLVGWLVGNLVSFFVWFFFGFGFFELVLGVGFGSGLELSGTVRYLHTYLPTYLVSSDSTLARQVPCTRYIKYNSIYTTVL